MTASYQLDPESKRFQDEVDALVRRWADGADYEYWRRWRQLGSWSIGRCQDCAREFDKSALQMHRLDTAYAHAKSKNFGYFKENVLLVCAACHHKRG